MGQPADQDCTTAVSAANSSYWAERPSTLTGCAHFLEGHDCGLVTCGQGREGSLPKGSWGVSQKRASVSFGSCHRGCLTGQVPPALNSQADTGEAR